LAFGGDRINIYFPFGPSHNSQLPLRSESSFQNSSIPYATGDSAEDSAARSAISEREGGEKNALAEIAGGGETEGESSAVMG
jgi:hypothetical protein